MHGLAAVGRIHLIAAAVAELRRRFGGFAEGAIESRGKFRGVGQDRRLLKPVLVERLRGWRPRGRPSCRRARRCRLRRARARRAAAASHSSVESLSTSPFDDLAAVAVAGVFAVADVGDQQQFGQGALHRAHGPLHDAVLGVGSEADSSFVSGMPNRMTPPMPNACALSHSLTSSSTESWKFPGMELIGLRTPSPGTTKRGRTNWDGSRWVSRTSRRMDSETRSRRLRWIGKDIRQVNCTLWYWGSRWHDKCSIYRHEVAWGAESSS